MSGRVPLTLGLVPVPFSSKSPRLVRRRGRLQGRSSSIPLSDLCGGVVPVSFLGAGQRPGEVLGATCGWGGDGAEVGVWSSKSTKENRGR